MDDVRDVERRDDVFVSSRGYRAAWNPDEKTMISQDDPAHQKQRRLLSPDFTPRAVEKQRAMVEAIVEELVDRMVAKGHSEVVMDLAAQLPARTTARLLGFDEARWQDVKSWSERLMRIDVVERDSRAMEEAFAAFSEYTNLLPAALEERRRCPRDDMFTKWAGASIDGCPMDLATIADETGLMISGGAETTRTSIARGIIAFCEHPDQWEAVAEDPSLVPGAVEEVLRWVTPLNNFFRVAARDATIRDTPVRSGDKVILLYASANRDEDYFVDPYRFDVGRSPNPHIAFGMGTHFCLGANFARLSLQAVFRELTRRIRRPRLAAVPRYEANVFVKAVTRLDLAYDRR
jgi:cytochrome P450 family 142 subfamily A polypeptide 1